MYLSSYPWEKNTKKTAKYRDQKKHKEENIKIETCKTGNFC